MTTEMTLDEIQEAQAAFDLGHEGAVPFLEMISSDNLQALEHLVVCLSGELGELANLVKKVRRGDFSLEDSRAAIIEETADLFIYTVKLANQMNFKLREAYLSKLELNQTRFARFEK